MRLREQYKHLLNYGANLITLLVEGFCFGYIWYTVYEEQFGFWRRGNWAVVGLYVLVIFFFTKVFGGYNIGYMRMTDIALSHILSILLSGIVGYLELCLICRDYVEPAPMLGVMAVEIVFILPWIYIIRKLYAKLYPPRQMLVIYGHYAPDELIAKINTRRDKYNICGSVSYEIGHEKLYPMIREYNAVVLCDLPAQARNQIMKFCYQESIRTYVTPKISDIIFRGADDIHLFDTPLLLSRNQGLSIDQRIIKRTCDIVLSLIGIVIASPFMLIIALAVKLYDGGPVFNILKGDMSMVGPRPERQVIADQYAEEIPEFVFRTKVKAGLTGYAQVYGKYNTTPYDKLKFDITYIENYSLWLDVKIMLLTFKILFQKENTEGVDETQQTALKD